MDQSPISAGELLAWYADAGVDVCLQDEPQNHFNAPAPQSKTHTSEKPAPQKSQKDKGASSSTQEMRPEIATIPDAAAIQSATDLAASSQNIEDLKNKLEEFEGCNLRFNARSTVFAEGDPSSDLMIIGDLPDRDEDQQGIPFVGRSGTLLEKMLTSIGLDRTKVYLTTVLPWRPPGSRPPTPKEADICRPFIEKHIELVDPKYILILGSNASGILLNSKKGLPSLRGKWHQLEIAEKTYNVLPSFHPGYLLKQPSQKRLAWQDLLTIAGKMNESS